MGSFLLGSVSPASADTLGLAPNTRVVQKGDTLWAIGLEAGTPWQELAALNQMANPNMIFVGEVIQLPSVPETVPKVTERPAPTVHATERVGTESPRTAASPSVVSRPVVRAAPTGGIWACIAQHESGGNPATNTGNGYYGAFQDTIGSWRSAGGGPGLPSDYSYSQQLAVNQRIQAQQGWRAWPATSRMCGVR
jgi:LysM repeat protein